MHQFAAGSIYKQNNVQYGNRNNNIVLMNMEQFHSFWVSWDKYLFWGTYKNILTNEMDYEAIQGQRNRKWQNTGIVWQNPLF